MHVFGSGGWYDGKQWFKLYHGMAGSPLRFPERLVWSYLSYKNIFGGATMYEVGRALRMDQGRSLPRIKRSLLDHGLVAPGDGRTLVALPPPVPEWFVPIKAQAGNADWRMRLAYVPVSHTPAGWTAQQVAVYFTLVSNADGYRVSKRSKQKGVAAMIGIDRTTVARTIKKLVALGLLECDYLRRPSTDVLSLFPDKPLQEEDEWDVIRAVGWPFVTMENGPYLDKQVVKHTAAMFRAGFSRGDVVKYWGHLYDLAGKTPGKMLDFLMLGFPALLQQCREETARNHGRGKYRGGNCLGLLMLRTGDRFGKPKTPTSTRSISSTSAPPKSTSPRTPTPPTWKTTEGPPGVDVEWEPTAREKYHLD